MGRNYEIMRGEKIDQDVIRNENMRLNRKSSFDKLGDQAIRQLKHLPFFSNVNVIYASSTKRLNADKYV